MKKIPLIIVEDHDYKDDLILDILNKASTPDMVFELKKAPLCNTLEGYKAVMSAISSLEGPAIFSFDLGLDVAASGFEKFYESEVDDCKVLSAIPNITTIAKSQIQGFWLIYKALKNENWYGVLGIATTSGINVEYDEVYEFLRSNGKNNEVIKVECSTGIPEHIKNPTRRQTVMDYFNDAIEQFKSRFGNIENRLWPKYTESWFPLHKRTGCPVPHNPPTQQQRQELENVKDQIRDYLKKLFLFEPPDNWFEDEQFVYLYDDLKSLIGEVSKFQGGNGRHCLSLGNLVLLLATADTKESSLRWLRDITWTQHNSRKPILPSTQVERQAKEAVETALEFFGKIIIHFRKGSSLIDKVELIGPPAKLKVTLNFDYAERIKEDEPKSVIEKVSELSDDGDSSEAYRRFINLSAKTDRGRESRLVVNLYTENKKTILEILHCR